MSGVKKGRARSSVGSSQKQIAFRLCGIVGWRKPDDGKIESFTIITTKPNDLVEPIHNRMPVMVSSRRIKLAATLRDFSYLLLINETCAGTKIGLSVESGTLSRRRLNTERTAARISVLFS
jgi:hypothetical protein